MAKIVVIYILADPYQTPPSNHDHELGNFLEHEKGFRAPFRAPLGNIQNIDDFV
jgi:hypothetical protein